MAGIILAGIYSLRLNFFTMDSHNDFKQLEERLKQLEQELAESKSRIGRLEKIIEGAQRKTTQAKFTPALSPNTAIENFVGLKLIHFVGIIVLIIGLSIGVKYAIDINLISPLLRIVLAYAAGTLLLLLSYKLRKRFQLFSLILFSGAMASLYFTTYAAFEYYQMLLKAVAFIAMLLLTVSTVYTALRYDRPQIAMLGLVGAYGIPFFVRGNTDNVFALLSYIALINLGVLFLTLKKYWPSLTQLAFITTWIIYFSCIYMDDANEQVAALRFYAITFFILFLLGSLGFKLYRKIPLTDTDSIALLLNTLFAWIAINLLYTKDGVYSWTNSTLVVVLLYLPAFFISRKLLPKQVFLANMLFVIGISALAGWVALRFSGFTITIIWLLLAILLFITGMYARIKILRLASIFLFALTLLKLLLIDSRSFTAVQKIIGYITTGTLLLLVSFLYQKFRKRIFDDE